MQVVIYRSWSIFYIVNIYCHQDRLFNWQNCWIYDTFLVLSSVDGYFQGSANFRPFFFFYSQCDPCLLCLQLPYNVYTYTSNCWINRSIITLEPQPAFTTLTTCAGLFCIWSHFNETGYFSSRFSYFKIS